MADTVFALNAQNLHQAFVLAWEAAKKSCLAGNWELVIREPKRTADQNAKLWACLNDVSTQCQLQVDGQMVTADESDWKTVFTAALRKEQRIAKGIDGGLVFLGARTSRMRKAEFSDLIEIIHAYGAREGVVWSEPALEAYATYREA